MTEAEFQATVIDLAHLYGWTVAHFRPAMTKHGWRTPVAADGKGFPDLLMVRRGRVLVAELKSEKGKLTDEQTRWIKLFLEADVEAHVWHPHHLDIAIPALLR